MEHMASFGTLFSTEVRTLRMTLPDAHVANSKQSARQSVGRRIDTANDDDSAMIGFQIVTRAFLLVVTATGRWALD